MIVLKIFPFIAFLFLVTSSCFFAAGPSSDIDFDRDYTMWHADCEHMQHAQALYPEHACKIVHNAKKVFLALLTDPTDVTIERAVMFWSLGSSDWKQTELFRAQADSISTKAFLKFELWGITNIFIQDDIPRTNALFFLYHGVDRKPYAKTINLRDMILKKDMALKDALPVHPLGEEMDWHEVKVCRRGDVLFAKRIVPNSLIAQYWTIRGHRWKLLHEGPFSDQVLRVEETDQVYRFTYADTGLTIDWLNAEDMFKPTNVKDFPVQLVHGDICLSSKHPRRIIALQDYHEGGYCWRFVDNAPTFWEVEGSGEVEIEDSGEEMYIGPYLDDISVLKSQYVSALKMLREQLRREGKSYTDRAISVTSFRIGEYEGINHLSVEFPENASLKMSIDISGGRPSISQDGIEDKFHPPLQMHRVEVEGQLVPYFYVSPECRPNGKTMVMVEGGPQGAYTGSYASFVKAFTQAGWAVIIPQESLRTGHGWKHFSKGIGEMGRKNLHQLLHVFQDAIDKCLIADLNQIHLYGCSYGGFVAASFALRWDELHEQAKLPKLFHFQSIVADAACLDITVRPEINEIFMGEIDAETFQKSFMPLYNVRRPLSAPLTLVHGKVDIRCSAKIARDFADALRTAGNPFNMFWHKGGHGLEHERYPEFLLALAEGIPTGDMETEMDLIREA